MSFGHLPGAFLEIFFWFQKATLGSRLALNPSRRPKLPLNPSRRPWRPSSMSFGHLPGAFLEIFFWFQKATLGSRLAFSLWNPTKTENEFPSKGKPQIPGKTSQQWRLKTYRDHTRTESFMKTSTEDFDNFLMTSTGHSDASVSCERLSSCAPGATATLDLGRPMQVPLPKRPQK